MGGRRIGLALSDPTGLIATPLGFLERTNVASDVSKIVEKASKYQVQRILVGLPLTTRGQMGPQSRDVERFCKYLREYVNVPVITWDERYSTMEAERLLRQAGRQPSRDKGRSDAAAAAVILQSYLNSEKRI